MRRGALADEASVPRWRAALPGLLFASVVLIVWADPVFTGRNFTGRDLIPYNLPMEKVIHDAYASWSLPIWNPYVSGGRPLLPNPNGGAMYPIRPLLARMPFAVAMRLYAPLHWIAAGVGMLMLLGSLRVGSAAAFIGAVTYVFSGPSISENFYTHIQPGFTLLPWIVWALLRRRGSRGGILLLGLLFGLDFLAADVFTGGLAIAVCVLWIATEVPRDLRKVEIFALVGAVVFGALLAAPQIVATALWIPQTNRAVLGMKLSDSIFFSVSPWRLLEFVVPYPFGATWELQATSVWGWSIFNGRALGLFSTLFVGALAPLAVVRLARRSLPGLSLSRWVVSLGLAVSVLPSLIPRAWRDVSSPLPLRNPEKLVIAVVLGLSIFAAHGVEEFRRRRPGPVAVFGVGALLAAAALAARIWSHPVGGWAAGLLGTRPSHAAVAAFQIPSALSEAGLLWMGTVVALVGLASNRSQIRAASLTLLALVPISANRKVAEISNPAEVFSPTAIARRVQREDPAGQFRVLGESLYHPDTREEAAHPNHLAEVEGPRREWTQHTSALWGRGTVFNSDFDSGDLSSVESLRKVSGIAAGFQDAGAFFGNLALKWGVRRRSRPAVAAYRPFGGDALHVWDELSPVFPDIRLAQRWREETDSVAALGVLTRIAPAELLLETGRKGIGSARPGSLKIIEKSANRLRLDYAVPDPTWLFVLRDDWPYRDIAIDGRAVEAVPAYLAFSAVPLPAGRHRLDWRERVPGLSISIFGPILCLALAGWTLRPRTAVSRVS